jgi:hypothetical protein
MALHGVTPYLHCIVGACQCGALMRRMVAATGSHITLRKMHIVERNGTRGVGIGNAASIPRAFITITVVVVLGGNNNVRRPNVCSTHD